MHLNEMFPDVVKERVLLLLKNEVFKASEALAKLKTITSKAGSREVAREVDNLVSIFYTPSMEALGAKLIDLGFNHSEISATHMIAQNIIQFE